MFFKHNQISIFWTFLVAFVCFMPGSNIPKDSIPGFDKIIHAVLFMGFYWFWMIGLIKQKRWKYLQNNVGYVVLAGSLLYGLLIEIIQGWLLPTRSADIWDFAANSVGIGFGYLFFRIIYGKWQCYASYRK